MFGIFKKKHLSNHKKYYLNKQRSIYIRVLDHGDYFEWEKLLEYSFKKLPAPVLVSRKKDRDLFYNENFISVGIFIEDKLSMTMSLLKTNLDAINKKVVEDYYLDTHNDPSFPRLLDSLDRSFDEFFELTRFGSLKNISGRYIIKLINFLSFQAKIHSKKQKSMLFSITTQEHANKYLKLFPEGISNKYSNLHFTSIANIDITVTIFDTYKQSNYGNEFFEMEKEDKQRVA
ncbi:MAG: hypothetical protein VXZ40_03725 [Nanoarchaeota archaeon]|nr:hypothetical protein [Nanoarchaeota archaeon]